MSLRNTFFLILFLYNFSFAHSVNIFTKPIQIKIHGEFYNLDEIDLKKDRFKYFEIKLFLNQKHFPNNQHYYLQIFCDIDNIISLNTKFKYDKKSIIIKLTKENLKTLHFIFKYKKPHIINFETLHMGEFEYSHLHGYKQFIFGLALGIVFCALLYNLIIYLNTLYKASLYYTGMQFFLFLLLFTSQIYTTDKYIISIEMLLDITSAMTIIFLLLFSYEILNLKDKKNYINFIYKALIILNFIDIAFILVLEETFFYQFINKSYLISLVLVTNILLTLKTSKESIFYIIGWLSIIITLIAVEHELFEIHENIIYSIGLPLESLFLSLALGLRLKNIIKDKEFLLIQQNKLASMGEMINNIAHQWRQPLANLSFINMDLQLAIKNNDIKRKYLEQISNDSILQINFMAETLDNFKGFYLPNKQKEVFLISNVVKKAVDIIQPSLLDSHISLNIIVESDSKINSYENEFMQVILNILNNAKEALLERKVLNPTIEIYIDKNQKSKSIIKIKDNAGGIEKEIREKIFDPYFSTKHKNSGIGLYMSKVIISSHLKGKITVKNYKKGSCFQILV